MKHFRIGQKVKVNPRNDNENYNPFRNKVLVVVGITKNKEEHLAYDEGMAPEWLYDLKTIDGQEVGFALYDYELEGAKE